jgi:hypothetical protein
MDKGTEEMLTREYQQRLVTNLRSIFGDELVEQEWDSNKFFPRSGNHRAVYAPRHDIAVGPFNSRFGLDVQIDKTRPMQSHPFTKRLYRDYLRDRDTLKKCWNSLSRCYLAVEIEFSGSSKQLLGGIINAVISGSIGIVIVRKANVKKAERLVRYLFTLEEFEKMTLNVLRNLIIFDDDDFLRLLSDFQRSQRPGGPRRTKLA